MDNIKNPQQIKPKIQDPKSFRDIQIPIEALISQCQVCEEKKADFYCKIDKVHYCQNCESQVHTPFMKKKHLEFIFIEPFIPKEETNQNVCNKHKKEFSLYCKDENELICTECYETCRKNNHSILGLNEYSNEISEKIKIIINKIEKEDIQTEVTIKRALVNQNKLQQEIKELVNYIKNESNLLIQKIQKIDYLKINFVNLLSLVGKLSNTNFTKILKEKEEKRKKINKNKIQIEKLKKFEKDEKTIKLICESKEMIEEDDEKMKKEKEKKEEREKERIRERERKSQELEKLEKEFDLLKYKKKITLKKSSDKWYKMVGNKIYSHGKHKIKIKIDHFPNADYEDNFIRLGVIETENKEFFNKQGDWTWEGAYYFRANWYWMEEKLRCGRSKMEYYQWNNRKNYSQEIKLKKNDIFKIYLDMDKYKISFKINEKSLEGWENLPESVNFFVQLRPQSGEEKNQISIF
ncbi:tripartite motif-containing protein [Anaeramoeba flamelloides]|uniref:Tripartite motif-containing protein n=1 Tax=Anaeramoeba flamelloides TaxID=1746091 RepID=A0AAV7Z122_9EUKA|nr:tripartite motif-containing protein [Anaeramoeba flamelloides]